MPLLIFLLVLSVLVLCHEAGHYVAARVFGVKAEEFGFGFPPRALGFVRVGSRWKRIGARDKGSYTGTIWSLNWLPLGGFVRLKGEQGEVRGVDAFATKPLTQRAIILLAGVTMNWLLAWTIFSVGFAIGIPAPVGDLPAQAIVTRQHIEINQVQNGSAAAQAGLQAGDVLLRVDETTVMSVAQAQQLLAAHAASLTPMHLSIERGTQSLTVEATPRYVTDLQRAGLGIGLIEIGYVRFPWYGAIAQGALVTFGYTRLILFAFGDLIRNLFVHQRLNADVSGPIGIAVMTGQIAQQGAWAVAQFAAVLSINLALINVFPIPALDGGRLLFVVIEAIRRRPSNQRLEALIHQMGFILLLLLILLVTVHDVRQYGHTILDYVF